MTDEANKHGGRRAGAGRKPAAAEEDLQSILRSGWPRTQRIATVKKVAERAARGDLKAAQFLMEYAYGKPREKKEVSGPGGSPIAVSLDEALSRVYGNPSTPESEEPT